MDWLDLLGEVASTTICWALCLTGALVIIAAVMAFGGVN